MSSFIYTIKNPLEWIAQKISEPYSREAYDKKAKEAEMPGALKDPYPSGATTGEAMVWEEQQRRIDRAWEQRLKALKKFKNHGEEEARELNKEYEKLGSRE